MQEGGDTKNTFENIGWIISFNFHFLTSGSQYSFEHDPDYDGIRQFNMPLMDQEGNNLYRVDCLSCKEKIQEGRQE